MGVVPTNTKKNNAWGERAFLAWVEEWNKAMPSDPVHDWLLACYYASIVMQFSRNCLEGTPLTSYEVTAGI